MSGSTAKGFPYPSNSDPVNVPSDFQALAAAIDAWTPPINAQTGTTYTLVIGDRDKIITLNNAASIAITIPPHSSVAFPAGPTTPTEVHFAQIGAGQVTIGQGAGVTITSNGGTATAPKLRGLGSVATALQITSDTWLVFGDIV